MDTKNKTKLTKNLKCAQTSLSMNGRRKRQHVRKMTNIRYGSAPQAQIHEEKRTSPNDDEPLSNSNCTQCLSLSACRQPLPPGPDPIGKKTALGNDEPVSNSNCLERLREFQLKMHRGGEGPFALCINIPL